MATNPQDDKRNPADPAALAKASPNAGKPLAPTPQQPAIEAGAEGDEIVDANVVGDVAEAEVEAEETSGLFGALGGVGLTAGGAAAVGAGAVGVAAIGSQGDTEQNPPASDGGGGSGPTGTPLDVVLGPLADAAGGGGGGGGDAGGPTGTPLDVALGPLADAAGGGGGGGGGGGPTGTPLDVALGPLADAAGGGGGGLPTTGTPLDQAINPINDGISQLQAASPADAEGGILGAPPSGLPSGGGEDSLLTEVSNGISSAAGGADLPVAPPSSPV